MESVYGNCGLQCFGNYIHLYFSLYLQNNFIKTSKYTLLTFLPLNLLEQFQRIANFYFLCLLLLQLIPQISSLTPVTTAIPLIGVLALTAVKDAYDDIVSAYNAHTHTYTHLCIVFITFAIEFKIKCNHSVSHGDREFVEF